MYLFRRAHPPTSLAQLSWGEVVCCFRSGNPSLIIPTKSRRLNLSPDSPSDGVTSIQTRLNDRRGSGEMPRRTRLRSIRLRAPVLLVHRCSDLAESTTWKKESDWLWADVDNSSAPATRLRGRGRRKLRFCSGVTSPQGTTESRTTSPQCREREKYASLLFWCSAAPGTLARMS